MENAKSARVYLIGRELPVIFSAVTGDRMGYRFEDDKSDIPGFLRIWAGSKTLLVPLDRLDALDLDV